MMIDDFPTGQGAVIRARWKYDPMTGTRIFTRVGPEHWSFVRGPDMSDPDRIEITNQSTIWGVEVLSEGYHEPEPTGECAVVLHNEKCVMVAIDDRETGNRLWTSSDGSGSQKWGSLKNPRVLFEGYNA